MPLISAMPLIRLLFVLVLAGGVGLGSAETYADTPVRDAVLYCDGASNRALLLFVGGWDDLPKLPAGLADGLDQLAPARDRICTLADGREIKARIGNEQSFPYGMCGADPAYFFSLWVDRKKVISAGAFYTGCVHGFSRRAIVLDGARLTDCRLVAADGQEDALRISEHVLTCSDASSLLAATQHDPVEYPANGLARPVHAIMVNRVTVRTANASSNAWSTRRNAGMD